MNVKRAYNRGYVVDFSEEFWTNFGICLSGHSNHLRFRTTMSQTKSKNPVLAILVVLTVIFAASTGYFLAYPNTITQTRTQSLTLTSTVSSPLYSVNIAYKQGIGFYLTNSSGWTLYFRTSDIQSNGTSRCTGNCIKTWPAFYATSLRLPLGLDASSFRPVTRTDGGQQINYLGWPLYYFSGDTKAGDTNGQGIGKVWYACNVPIPIVPA